MNEATIDPTDWLLATAVSPFGHIVRRHLVLRELSCSPDGRSKERRGRFSAAQAACIQVSIEKFH